MPIYLHSKINRHFTSAQRETLISRAVKTYKKENILLCPFNKNSCCEAYEIRPARCRIYRANKFSKDKQEIQNLLLELSQTLFLAFSGKFVQKCFHYMSDIEKKTKPLEKMAQITKHEAKEYVGDTKIVDIQKAAKADN